MIVAENKKGEIIGFADCWKRETNTVSKSSDLTSIYILKEYQGIGLGKELLKSIFFDPIYWGIRRYLLMF
ncbi:GNAT family N-acetyltransferase [Paenibacillus illinoisensis]|uniref:GNAT family N-acetyltransferase n=1 Tax=Paenibacillus illinoisensis TaxID=59845 RepID=A0ABW8HSB2_9BACL